MPGFIGGSSSGSSGTGGEISFPKEFIDPVTKLRVSQPENLIDTDFEYGLQPTKWETVELINNTPSFFSKGGDTTIPGIVSVITNAGTREVTVTTALEHGLAVGIPISVTGTKSITADGAYIINSIPNANTFTYLCKDNQLGNNSIEDLYTSIVTGEFFQGAQLRISDSEGIITDSEDISTLTVKTESTHGFGEKTPFYFLNLNSTISQEFEAANTAAKSFDSSNSATAQTFDGSNTLSTFNIDWSNSATIGGATSAITNVNVETDLITVTHTTENFVGKPLGTPLYYNVSASTGYFNANPRGVVFLKTINDLGVSTSAFQVSETPDGEAIDIISAMTGTFQLANQARTFAGNNRDLTSEVSFSVLREDPIAFDGGNQGFPGASGTISETNGNCTVLGFTGDSILVSTTAGAGLDYYVGAMVKYTTTGAAATNLINGETYFVYSIVSSGANLYTISIKNLPTSPTVVSASGGTGTQSFSKIGVSLTRDIIHARDSAFVKGDLLEYEFPVNGRFTAAGTGNKLFYVVQTAYDAHNYLVDDTVYIPVTATGGTTTDITSATGRVYRTHSFTTPGTTNFVIADTGTQPTIEYLIVAGGGAGGSYVGGGGGAGGVLSGTITGTVGTFPIVVGTGGAGVGSTSVQQSVQGTNGGNSSAFGLTAIGGGGGSRYPSQNGSAGGSGGGAGGMQDATGIGGAGTAGQGNAGGNSNGGRPRNFTGGAGGGGAGAVGGTSSSGGNTGGDGGAGVPSEILGTTYYFGGGGGGGNYTDGLRPGNGGVGGGGSGSSNAGYGFGAGGGSALNTGGIGSLSGDPGNVGGDGGANTGGGGGGNGHFGRSGAGGSGIVIVRYAISQQEEYIAPVATGGSTTDVTYDATPYRIHRFPTVGTTNFIVQSVGSMPSSFEYLIVGGGAGGGAAGPNQGLGAGGGAGGVRTGKATLTAGTFPIVVGGGGAGSSGGASGAGGDGGQSSAFGIAALGGGGGGQWWTAARVGASGGGGGNQDGGNNQGANGTAGQGNRGGNGSAYNGGVPNPSGTGGGGGFFTTGRNATSDRGGSGGEGYVTNISGSTLAYAGGGGGGATGFGGRGGASGSGADGGSGYANGGVAPANRGGGGGGASDRNNGNAAGGAGGSGVVIIRYPIGNRAY